MEIQLTFMQIPGQPEHEDQGDLAVQTGKPELKPPPRYQVVMLNDDYTPMDFVVEVLEVFFSLDRESATRVMLQVHTEGKAVCGVYSKDVAEDRKSTRLNSSHVRISYAVFCLKKKKIQV